MLGLFSLRDPCDFAPMEILTSGYNSVVVINSLWALSMFLGMFHSWFYCTICCDGVLIFFLIFCFLFSCDFLVMVLLLLSSWVLHLLASRSSNCALSWLFFFF
jgi:hypothetical protein